MTMRERIARTILDCLMRNGMVAPGAHAVRGRKAPTSLWETYLPMADAVLFELREPTPAMVRRATDTDAAGIAGECKCKFVDRWHEAVYATLSEEVRDHERGTIDQGRGGAADQGAA